MIAANLHHHFLRKAIWQCREYGTWSGERPQITGFLRILHTGPLMRIRMTNSFKQENKHTKTIMPLKLTDLKGSFSLSLSTQLSTQFARRQSNSPLALWCASVLVDDLEVFPRKAHGDVRRWEEYLANPWSSWCTLSDLHLKVLRSAWSCSWSCCHTWPFISPSLTFCCVVKCRWRIPFLPLLWHHLCSQEHAQLVPICRGISGVGIGSPPSSRRLTTGMENILAAVTWKSAHLTLSMSLSLLSHQQDSSFFFARVAWGSGVIAGTARTVISVLRLIQFNSIQWNKRKPFLLDINFFS